MVSTCLIPYQLLSPVSISQEKRHKHVTAIETIDQNLYQLTNLYRLIVYTDINAHT